MKKYMTLILVGVIVVLSATLVGVLTFMDFKSPKWIWKTCAVAVNVDLALVRFNHRHCS